MISTNPMAKDPYRQAIRAFALGGWKLSTFGQIHHGTYQDDVHDNRRCTIVSGFLISRNGSHFWMRNAASTALRLPLRNPE